MCRQKIFRSVVIVMAAVAVPSVLAVHFAVPAKVYVLPVFHLNGVSHALVRSAHAYGYSAVLVAERKGLLSAAFVNGSYRKNSSVVTSGSKPSFL